MTYNHFEREIMHMVASATNASRLRFALDTIGLLGRSAEAAIEAQMSEAERGALAEIMAGVETGSAGGLRPKLEELTNSLCKDEVRAIEFHPDITELLCALDSFLEYADTKDPKLIGRIALNMVNSIDHAIVGDSKGYSIDNMMGANEMRNEYERQKALLVGP
jgi:hypothetical protein